MGSGAVSFLLGPPPFVARACALVLTPRPVAARGAGPARGRYRKGGRDAGASAPLVPELPVVPERRWYQSYRWYRAQDKE